MAAAHVPLGTPEGALALRTVELARICVWTADLPQLHADHDALAADIDALLERGERNRAAYGEQTATILHELEAPHWRRFFAQMRRVVSEIVVAAPGTLDQGTVHLRAWASRLGAEGAEDDMRQLRLRALHNHAPAFLSAVYFLRLPPGLSEGEGGTFFVNPFAHPLASPHPGIVVAPAEGRVVAFPSGLMHGPLLLDPARLARPRTVIAVDAHFIPR